MRLAYVALVALAMTTPGASAQESFEELLARPRPTVDRHITYGTDADQFGDLYLPKTNGPHPVVVLIHGGCWSKRLPGLDLMALLAGDLRDHGFAVWNIEYRRLGGGGGYPATFVDAGAAIDRLRGLAQESNLDLHHLVLVGHSAGGHLALWAAGRNRLPVSSPLHQEHPLAVSAVVTLSGINDLSAFRERGPGVCGEPRTVDRLVDAAGRVNANLYNDTSPAAMLPLGIKQFIVTASGDDVVPAEFGRDYAAHARTAGDAVQYLNVPDAGHFELIDPRSAAWKQIVPLIQAAAH